MHGMAEDNRQQAMAGNKIAYSTVEKAVDGRSYKRQKSERKKIAYSTVPTELDRKAISDKKVN